MKKPTEAIERIRGFATLGEPWGGGESYANLRAILAYLDSIPEWPADLTRERLEELASNPPPFANNDRSDALRRLAAIAPKRGKRKVELWYHESWADAKPPYAQYAGQSELINGVDGWRKVGVAEIDA